MLDIKKLFLEDIEKMPLLAIVPILGSTTRIIDALIVGASFIFVALISYFLRKIFSKIIVEKHIIISYFLIAVSVTTILSMILEIFLIDFYLRLKIYIILIPVTLFMIDIMSKHDIEKNFKTRTKFIIFRLSNLFFTLVIIAMIREFFGAGTMLGYSFLSQDIPKILILQTQSGAYFTLALWCFLINLASERKK